MTSDTNRNGVPRILAKFVESAGRMTSILVLVAVLQIVLRYVFARGLVALKELE